MKKIQPQTQTICRPFMVPLSCSPYRRDDPDDDQDCMEDGHKETDESTGDILYQE